MELSARKQAILEAIINSYIETGEPIGSKALCTMLGTSLSSATLRNEMSELCEMGYLTQPHTSAGRIPTNEAYKLYIKTMLKPKEPPQRVRATIDDMLLEAAKDPVHISSLAAQFLANFTGLPTLLATVGCESSYVRRVEVLPMGRRTVLVLLVSSDGVAKSRFCRINEDVTPSLIARFDRIVSDKVVGRAFTDFSDSFLQSLAVSAGEKAMALSPLLSSIFAMVDEIANANISFGGNAYGLSENQNKLMPFIADISGKVDIVFGDATGIDELKPSNVVVARYHVGNNEIGRIGVIGPTRMAYRQMLPSVQYFAEKLGQILEQTMIDMEE